MNRLVGLFVAVLLPVFACAAQPSRKPNLIFVMADDLGYGHLGAYGQKHIQTPHLDRMAAGGMKFTNAYAGSAVCAPSRSCLMTGTHPGHTPIRSNGGGAALRPEDVTVAEVLKSAGYTTGLFGKWGLGDAGSTGVPSQQGFDEYFGYLHQVHAHRYYPEYLWKNDQKVYLDGNTGGGQKTYAHDITWDAGLEFIRKNRDRPFFAYFATIIPHVELIVPEDSLKQYSGKWAETPFADPRPGYAAPKEPKATLAAMITRLDRDMGRLFDLLKELKIDDNTLVIFTSDNGAQGGYGCHPEFFNATGGLRGVKTQLFEGGLRVPLIARWPGKIKAGVTTDQLWAHWDLMATAAELGGASMPAGTDSLSVLPTILGKPSGQKQHEYLYWELQNEPKQPLMQAVRMGNWKAVKLKPDGAIQLFDLARDAGEATNVAQANRPVVARIEKILVAARTEPRVYPPERRRPGEKPYR